jgi:hypothetical protein
MTGWSGMMSFLTRWCCLISIIQLSHCQNTGINVITKVKTISIVSLDYAITFVCWQIASIEIGAFEYDTRSPHSQRERDSQQYGAHPAPAYALPLPMWVHGAAPEFLLWNAALHVSCRIVQYLQSETLWDDAPRVSCRRVSTLYLQSETLWDDAPRVSCKRVRIYRVKHCGKLRSMHPVEEFSVYRVNTGGCCAPCIL